MIFTRMRSYVTGAAPMVCVYVCVFCFVLYFFLFFKGGGDGGKTTRTVSSKPLYCIGIVALWNIKVQVWECLIA